MPLFGTSGIRGVVDQDLTPGLCHEVAQALATSLTVRSRVCLATDTRVSRNVLKEAIIAGLLSCGVDVTDLGILPTPVLALLTREWEFDAGIMVTASHNPPEFNGIKLFNRDSIGYSPEQEWQIERLYSEKQFREAPSGMLQQGRGMRESYLDFIRQKLPVKSLNRGLKVVIDAGNGAASGFVTSLFTDLDLQVLPLNDVPDGLFPGRSPEPRGDTLQTTVDFLREKEADLALCFDGDADRVVFCDREGFLGFNEPTAFISRLVAERSPKSRIASTVESGRLLELAVQDLGVEVVRGKVGDVHLAHLTREAGASIGTEQVGVYIIPEAGYYPDSIFAALVLLSRVGKAGEIRELFAGLPRLFFDKSKVPCPNPVKESVMQEVRGRVESFESKGVNDLDGIRLEFDDAWLLIRASGTEPAIRVIAESESPSRTKELLARGTVTVQAIVDKRR